MGPKFFIHKMKEVLSFLQIMKGKILRNDQERMEGVENALKAMKKEKEDYIEEKQKILAGGKQKRRSGPKDKVLRESGNETPRDISAI